MTTDDLAAPDDKGVRHRRCQGKTKRGKRCKRAALAGAPYCSAHERTATPDERVRRLFRHFHPTRANDSGHQAWFRRELAGESIVLKLATATGIDVSPKTISLWLRNGIPSDRMAAVEETIVALEEVMCDDLEALLAKVRE